MPWSEPKNYINGERRQGLEKPQRDEQLLAYKGIGGGAVSKTKSASEWKRRYHCMMIWWYHKINDKRHLQIIKTQN
jgi:hypothetical protein